jgi:hypothetical protein
LVGLDLAHPLVGRGDVEHDDVLGMVGKDAVEVAGADGRRPALDQLANLFLVGIHLEAWSFTGLYPEKTLRNWPSRPIGGMLGACPAPRSTS